MSSIPLANLSLFPATPEQTLESRKRTAVQWANGLTAAEYVRRDVVMDAQEHAAEGNLTTWVLAPRTDPATLDFFCSCETFRRTAAIARPGAHSEAEEVVAYGVASVYTPPEKRRNGYARHMMRLLHWVLAPRSTLPTFPPAWGAPPDAGHGNAQFSILYSDLGSQFYHACGPDEDQASGWAELGSIETSLTLPLVAILGSAADSSHSWMWLTEDDVKRVWEQDAEWMKADLAASASSTGRLQAAFLPNKGVADSTVQRTMAFQADMQPVLPLDTWGVFLLSHEGAALRDVLTDHEGEYPTFATWSLDTLASSRTLIVTRLRATKRTLPALVQQLLEYAGKCDARKIEIWGMQEELQEVANGLGWTTSARPNHLSSFKWYGKEVGEEIDWMFNEKGRQLVSLR
ncbi:uncharacterized protein FIBRA_08945 [Fibroporia radiculosa]|uniref:LYC1 C-terminal domain-containing protein n=1 Tax=Fibroporia radiculosa TaxID=599839 RepID=J4GXN8_9APHY|nr:uncharacterized protein FIBRA_08945 [Fibroporia radiculosa]CCM06660.1 predicted protein [Fibroporia radiculosa]